MTNFATIDSTLWFAFEDGIQHLLPHLTEQGLRRVADDLRPDCGGRWGGLASPLEARRRLLLNEVAELIEGMGRTASPGDLLPVAPDFIPSSDDGVTS